MDYYRLVELKHFKHLPMLIFFIFNRIIKMSSPNINNLFLVGCVMCYIAAIVFGIDSNSADSIAFAFTCSLRVWLLSIGFSIAFGSLLSKTWRVYRIFTSGRRTKIVCQFLYFEYNSFYLPTI